METKRLKSLSVAAFIVSILPLLTLLPAFLKITLPEGMHTIVAGVNILFALTGLILSIVCVRPKESRSAINIISAAISSLWLLMMVGIVVLALILNVL